MNPTQYPYDCRIMGTEEIFIPTIIDYEKRRVYRSGDDWFSFDEINFTKNPRFIQLYNKGFNQF